MNDNKETNTVRGFCLGGLGFNIGAQLETFRDHQIPGTAKLDLAYADTSDSDLIGNPEIDRDNCFFLPNAAGSGKFQGQHSEAIDTHLKSMLQRFKPSSTLNIIIASASGGSGPAWAVTLASELLAADLNVVVIIVGTTADVREIRNTKNNIDSYMNVAEDTGKPVPLAYFQNSPETPREAVNKAIIGLVGSLCALFSGENHGLDRQDLYNFLHFNENRTTSYKARVAQLTMYDGDQNIGDIGNVISVATLTTRSAGHEISQTPEYQVVGRVDENTEAVIIRKAPVHFVLSTGRLSKVKASLDGKLAEMKEKRESLVDDYVAPVAKGNKRGLVTD